jgi:hypothetical protein
VRLRVFEWGLAVRVRAVQLLRPTVPAPPYERWKHAQGAAALSAFYRHHCRYHDDFREYARALDRTCRDVAAAVAFDDTPAARAGGLPPAAREAKRARLEQPPPYDPRWFR